MATIPDLTLDAGMPANIDAEKTILGAILLDNAAHSEAAEKIEADDFSLDSHRRIFLRMSELMNSQRAVDIVTLANELARYKEVEAVGGVAYLASLTEGLPRRPTKARPPSKSSAPPSRNSSKSARKASPTASSPSTRSSSTPSAPSTICTNRAAKSPAWPLISLSLIA